MVSTSSGTRRPYNPPPSEPPPSQPPPHHQPPPQEPPPPVTQPTPPPPPAGPVWDSSGWKLLGQQTVSGRNDRDTIEVGGRDQWDHLTMVVLDSDMELTGFTITYGNNTTFTPPGLVGYAFREGQRTRVIDLTGHDHVIKKIDLRYRNLPGGGRARVEIWGRDTRDPKKSR